MSTKVKLTNKTKISNNTPIVDLSMINSFNTTIKSSLKKTIYGKVLSVIDGVVLISGLRNVKSGETLKFINDEGDLLVLGMALNLNEVTVGAVLFGDERLIIPGTHVIGTGSVIGTFIGTQLLGRVVNALGQTIDGNDMPKNMHYQSVDIKAPGVI